MQQAREYVRLKNNSSTGILHDIDWDFKNSQNNGIHSIHPYPAKYIPQIPKTLLETLEISPGTLVFDPFCGCGTTLIVAQSLGLPSIGVDLNPIGCLISRVVTRDCPVDLAREANQCILKAQSIEATLPIPPIPNLDHWFQKPIQNVLIGLITVINEIEDAHLRDALRLALSSLIVRVSNQDSDTRYAAIEKPVAKDEVYSLFYHVCQKYERTLPASSASRPDAIVINKDIFDIAPSDFPNQVGMVICSPPYPASYEYWLYHKYRMWWLGYDPLSVKKHEIGARAHFFKKNHHGPEDFRKQMTGVFQLLTKVCCPDAYVCFVLGDSKIHGEIIDNTDLLISAAIPQGFQLIDVIPRNIAMNRKSFNISNSRIQTENIVILQK